MNKFKVGDKVRRIQGEHNGMKVGDESTITAIYNTIDFEMAGFRGNCGTFHALYSFELVEPKQVFDQEIRLIISDKSVVLLDKDGNRGLASRHPDDEFDLNIGLPLAMERLLEAQEEAKKYKKVLKELNELEEELAPIEIYQFERAKEKDSPMVSFNKVVD
jgi:hypothetical protein